MLSFPGSLRIFLSVEPCDMRKSFNGLYALAEEKLGEAPRRGALFVFCNRRRNKEFGSGAMFVLFLANWPSLNVPRQSTHSQGSSFFCVTTESF